MATETLAAPDQIDSFAQLANTHPAQAIMLMFWKQRHQNPGFSMEIHPQDIEGFKQCVDYLEATPEVRIFRPPGLPAQDPIPARGNRNAVPGRAAKPPKDYVVVQMVDSEGNAIVPVENNEEDQSAGRKAQEMTRLKENAPRLANQLLADIRNNTLSNTTIQEAADTLMRLSKA